jgi:hypothetical protein
MRETPRSSIFSRTMVLFERCISANIFLWDALEGLILLGIKYLPSRLQFDATKPELYTKTLVEEFIDNIEMSWDDVMTDAIVNCSLVIRGEFYHAINYPRGPRAPSQRGIPRKHSIKINSLCPFQLPPSQ